MDFTNPIVIQFKPGTGAISRHDNILEIPAFAKWNDFKSEVSKVVTDHNYDYAILSYKNVGDDLDNPSVIKTLNIKSNALINDASKKGLRVFNRFDNQMFFLNPSFDENKTNGKLFAPSDDVVLTRRDSFEDDYAWQKHQANIINKFAVIMPLTSGDKFESTNHKAMLTAPSRGLSDKDLDGFFSWKANETVIPELMGDSMIGIPSIKAVSFSDYHLKFNGSDLGTPINLKTVGLQGAMIPMRNPHGDAPKYQIATDISPINIILKARAADGISIQKSEFYNKKLGRFGEYNFTMNGIPSHLTVVSADNDKITMSDNEGQFDVHLKEEIKPLLERRGYELPELIDSIKPNANAKYIWMSPGTMLGSKDINNSKDPEYNRISPSLAGFVTAREPLNDSDEYIVLVAEGALKGIITAKYLDRKDVNGNSVADFIAGERGIIVAQVPGVAASFVKSVERIYDEKHVIGTYIAMDADGRDNLSVANGIHSAYDELGQHSPVKVMSWNPEQKGIDDALIAIGNHQITVEDMDIHFGSPEKLFPLDSAVAPNPYKLDGSRANGQAWQQEYRDDKAERDTKLKAIQANSDDINLSLDGIDSDSLSK